MNFFNNSKFRIFLIVTLVLIILFLVLPENFSDYKIPNKDKLKMVQMLPQNENNITYNAPNYDKKEQLNTPENTNMIFDSIYRSKTGRDEYDQENYVNIYDSNFGGYLGTSLGDIISIPNIIFQTYISKDRVPIKVFENIKKYTNKYNYQFYDDLQCLEFLKKNFGNSILTAYNNLITPAHKADLFRYCILYKYGGIYLDIKTELIMPLDEIFNSNYTYTVISSNDKSIYQGIIATKRNNPIFLKLIKQIVDTSSIAHHNYLIYTNYFYHMIQHDTENYGKLNPGINTIKIPNQNDFYLFSEKCNTKNASYCYDGFDRYGGCCNVYDFNKKIIKTRYADYSW